MPALTPETQVALLLCSRLGQREGELDSAKPLTARQYSLLEDWLRDRSLQPSDFLHQAGRDQVANIELNGILPEKLELLLDRGAALALLVERWTSQGLWVICRNDPEYPTRYLTYLEKLAPPVLYGVGEVSLLNSGGLAIVGSRNISEEEREFAQRAGRSCAEQGICVVSGAAKGIDAEAMQSAVDQGGHSVGVLAEGLGRASVSALYRNALLDGHLTLTSPYEPDARWLIYAAMDRNKLVYGLAEAALVVSSGDEDGGTWTGAKEALKRKRIPVYVRDGDEVPPGNRKLIQAGARAFSDESWSDLSTLFQYAPVSAPLFEQGSRHSEACEKALDGAITDTSTQAGNLEEVESIIEDSPATCLGSPKLDLYACVVQATPRLLREPQSERSFAETLLLVPAQSKAWLKRLVEDGQVQRLKNPIRYVAESAVASLFVMATHELASEIPPLDLYACVLQEIPRLLSRPQNADAFARVLGVVRAQAQVWLKRALAEGAVRKLKSSCYVAALGGNASIPRQEVL